MASDMGCPASPALEYDLTARRRKWLRRRDLCRQVRHATMIVMPSLEQCSRLRRPESGPPLSVLHPLSLIGYLLLSPIQAEAEPSTH